MTGWIWRKIAMQNLHASNGYQSENKNSEQQKLRGSEPTLKSVTVLCVWF